MQIFASASTGMTLAATIQRLSDSFYWNPGATAFQAAPVFANKKNDLTEQSAENSGTYAATVNSMGDAGEVLVRIHDTSDSNRTVSLYRTYLVAGEENKNSKIADTVLRRPFGTARTSATGDTVTARSLLGMMARFVNKWEVVAGDLVIYLENDSTPFVTIPLTSDDAAEPIIAMDPPA